MALGGIFDFDNKSERLEEVIRELESPVIWNNPEQAQAFGKERAQLEAVVHQLQRLRHLHSVAPIRGDTMQREAKQRGEKVNENRDEIKNSH